MIEILNEMGQELLRQLAWWKIFVALGGSIVVTAIALGLFIWAEQHQSDS